MPTEPNVTNQEVADAIHALVVEIRALRGELQRWHIPYTPPVPMPQVPTPWWSPVWSQAQGTEGTLYNQ